MSDTDTMSRNRATSSPTPKRVLNVALWVLQVLLALQFAMAGLTKIFGDPAMVEMFATIGIGQWFRYVVGTLELAGAVGLLIPRLSGPAALGLVCVMVGATLTNLFVLNANPLLPVVLASLGALVVWGALVSDQGATR